MVAVLIIFTIGVAIYKKQERKREKAQVEPISTNNDSTVIKDDDNENNVSKLSHKKLPTLKIEKVAASEASRSSKRSRKP